MTEYCLPKATAIPNFVSVYDTEKESKLTTTSLTFGDTVYGDGEITGQIVFTKSPIVPEPLEGMEATNKNYVDGLVGQRSGGLTLFLNYEDGEGTLSPSPCEEAVYSVKTSSTGVDQLVATFTTVAYPGVKTLPMGNIIWTQYGSIDDKEGTAAYKFKLYKVDSSGVALQIGTSAASNQVDSLSPSTYTMAVVLATDCPLNVTDRLRVELYHSGESDAELTSYFNAEYFSYLQTTLVEGTSLLAADNTWTNSNEFKMSPTVPTPVASDNSTLVATTAYVKTALSSLLESAQFTALSTVTQSASVSSTLVATTAYVTNAIATALSGSGGGSGGSGGSSINFEPIQMFSAGPAYITAPSQPLTFALAWIRPDADAVVANREIWLPTLPTDKTSQEYLNFNWYQIKLRNDSLNTWAIRSDSNVYYSRPGKTPLKNNAAYTWPFDFNYINMPPGPNDFRFVAFEDHLGELAYMTLK